MLSAPLLLATLMPAQPQTNPPILPLWEGKAPHAVGDSLADKPHVTVFRPAAGKANGTAVVICPGGGYGFLADDHEGKQAAEFMNTLGVTAFVLKYRIVTKDRPGPLHPAPLEDAQRAIRLVRSKAADYEVNPGRVGIWGFSAGGHLASSAATHFDTGKKGDSVDGVSCRPDFAILAYPVISMETGVTHGGSRNNLLGSNPDAKLVEYMSNDRQVTKNTPPTFIFHTSEDKSVLAENPVRFYLACKAAGVPCELHIYEKGRHGVGLGRDPKWTGGEPSVATWPDRLADWMRSRGLLTVAK
ncbi:MAG: alpha/beta hydrolase [Gemmataceae bacterium]